MKSAYAEPAKLEAVFMAMNPQNALAMRVALATGLRIGDILSLKKADVAKPRCTIHEQKTGKARRITIPHKLKPRLLNSNHDSEYCFRNARNKYKHRSRQAVYLDLRRIAKAFRLKQVSPHSARKAYAVEQMRANGGDIRAVQSKLNHSSIEVTLLYALADHLK
jgi:integrase